MFESLVTRRRGPARTEVPADRLFEDLALSAAGLTTNGEHFVVVKVDETDLRDPARRVEFATSARSSVRFHSRTGAVRRFARRHLRTTWTPLGPIVTDLADSAVVGVFACLIALLTVGWWVKVSTYLSTFPETVAGGPAAELLFGVLIVSALLVTFGVVMTFTAWGGIAIFRLRRGLRSWLAGRNRIEVDSDDCLALGIVPDTFGALERRGFEPFLSVDYDPDRGVLSLEVRFRVLVFRDSPLNDGVRLI